MEVAGSQISHHDDSLSIGATREAVVRLGACGPGTIRIIRQKPNQLANQGDLDKVKRRFTSLNIGDNSYPVYDVRSQHSTMSLHLITH